MIERRLLRASRDPRPDSKIGKVRIALMDLIEEHRRDGALPTSVRFLFYELVMKRIVAKQGERPDKIVSQALLPQPLERVLVRETRQRARLRRIIAEYA
jgi:hypothetical protein